MEDPPHPPLCPTPALPPLPHLTGHALLTIPRITKFLEPFEVQFARPSSNFCSSQEYIHCREGQRPSKLNCR
ncbi:hypothetical protein E2C01_101952 [Portunus trituberculatus]|uniref:Uncharacterized protein n=1 Tax=Portunus trituberculatus TaxID=210409 RepID=A0A5B7KG44_PORTR|nr:hypothetical protein [Portunus trituberculatus]